MIKRHVKLNLSGRGGTVEVNGEPLKGVRSVTLTAGVNAFPALTVDLLLHQVEADGEMLITVPEKTAASLVALGWTPPAPQVGVDYASSDPAHVVLEVPGG